MTFNKCHWQYLVIITHPMQSGDFFFQQSPPNDHFSNRLNLLCSPCSHKGPPRPEYVGATWCPLKTFRQLGQGLLRTDKLVWKQAVYLKYLGFLRLVNYANWQQGWYMIWRLIRPGEEVQLWSRWLLRSSWNDVIQLAHLWRWSNYWRTSDRGYTASPLDRAK